MQHLLNSIFCLFKPFVAEPQDLREAERNTCTSHINIYDMTQPQHVDVYYS
jgi:hypothetical protein